MLSMNRNIDLGLLILRLSVGGLMLLHGIAKIMHGVGPIQEMIISSSMPGFFAYGVYIGEVVAPLFIILGVATRASSIVFSINCLVAMFMVHSSDLFTLTATGGWAVELLGLYLFGAAALAFTGGGKYALSKKYIWD